MSRLFSLVLSAVLVAPGFADDGLKKRIDDKHASGQNWWVYNDLSKAFASAKDLKRPLFVTFRCVPCKACAGFDAEVATDDGKVKSLAQTGFIPVRQVEMKGVDLNIFRFDFDLNWAAVFVAPDGTVLGRYGTQSAKGPDAFNSMKGLHNTMQRVLKLYKNYPGNKAELAGKQPKKWTTAKPEKMKHLPSRLRQEAAAGKATTRRNCIHCHMIHDAQTASEVAAGRYKVDNLYRYPLPDNVGLSIDADQGIVIKTVRRGSPAATAGLKAGEEVTHMNGQAMTSIADMQWVLHHLPGTRTTLTVTGSKTGKVKLNLPAGWRKHDFSWRGSMYAAPPRFSVWCPPASAAEKRRLGVGNALKVRWINNGRPSGRAAATGGLRTNDFIVGVGGKPLPKDHRGFTQFLKLNYKKGDKLPLTVIRRGRKVQLSIKLVE